MFIAAAIGLIAVSSGAVPAQAASPGVELIEGGSSVVRDWGEPSYANVSVHAHGMDISGATVRFDLSGLSSRVHVVETPPNCSRPNATLLVCPVPDLPADKTHNLAIGLRADKDAAHGPGGKVLSKIVSGVPANNPYDVTQETSVYVQTARKPNARVTVDKVTAVRYLHVGDVFDAYITVRNHGPDYTRMSVAVADPLRGLTSMGWLNCVGTVDGGHCLRQDEIPAGSVWRVGMRFKVISKAALEPLFFAPGTRDASISDNTTTFPLCVYETGLCTGGGGSPSSSQQGPSTTGGQVSVTATISAAVPTQSDLQSATPSLSTSESVQVSVTQVARERSVSSWPWLLGGGGAIGLLAGVVTWVRRRRETAPEAE